MSAADQPAAIAPASDVVQAAIPGHIPRHICIIMDGNHRWAKRKRLPGAAGHRAGAKMLRRIAEACADMQVQHLTLFAFSTENWQRPRVEVNLLMDLMRHVMENDLAELHQREVKLRIIGDRSRFAPDIRAKMDECEALTNNNCALNLNVAVNFGGRWDIVSAARQLAQQVQTGVLQAQDIDEQHFAALTSLGALPDPDLLIRTGGEHRISNFLLWDLAYTEIYFTDTYWPDFDENCLQNALAEFARRARRFGGRQ